VELEVGGARERIEIEIPAEHPAAEKSRIAFRPRYWKLFPAGGPEKASSETSAKIGA